MKSVESILAEIDRLLANPMQKVCKTPQGQINEAMGNVARTGLLFHLKEFILAPDDCEHVFFSDHNQTFKVVCKKCGVIQ